MITKVIKVDSASKVASAARKAACALEGGKIVAFATETVYGLAALATAPGALDRLREIKNRPARPFTLHLSDRQAVRRYVKNIPPQAQRLMKKGWPGPVTILLPVGKTLPDKKLQSAGMYDKLCDNGLIGLRCPDEPVALAMLDAVDGPVVAPSANLAGAKAPHSASEVLDTLDGAIDLVLDSGPTSLGQGSTIVRFGEDGWRTVRKGPLDSADIRSMMGLKILVVCTGNTCRSPIAEGIITKLLAEREPCSPEQLSRRGISVISAGLYAGGGGATPEAIQAAMRLGANISSHKSRNVTPELINEADVVFCMTDFHVSQVHALSPESRRKVFRLDPEGDVPDPIGGGMNVYMQTARCIEGAVKLRLEEDSL